MKNIAFNNRSQTVCIAIVFLLLILTIVTTSYVIPDSWISPNISQKSCSPSWQHLFGTDWLGRDMFWRTISGFKISLQIGLFTAIISTIISIILGVASAMGNKVIDEIISWLIDLFISMPHLVFMLLISFMLGGGAKGIIIAVSLTHWTTLARLVRIETKKILAETYIQVSRELGRSKLFIWQKHIIPHIVPQIIVGFVLLFPHVILHESALTFLGFGLSPQTPAIGIILSEGMTNISSGDWWLILMPSIFLIFIVKVFEDLSERLRNIFNPIRAQE